MKPQFKTLDQFIIEKQADFPNAKGELSRLLRDIGIAAKIVNREINRAGLAGVLGETDYINIQGECQQRLDVYANEQFITALKKGRECCAVVSEENDEPVIFDSPEPGKGSYIVAIDPLDGSSNIDVNVGVGTIFSIYRRVGNAAIKPYDLLQDGNRQVAAGYVIYGSSTMLVYTTGNGVNGFTLDPFLGEFCLSHLDMMIPDQGKIYSVNEGNYNRFPESVKQYIRYCQEEDQPTGRPYSSRYIGSLVADFHRNLIKGGIFIYPPMIGAPNGKLRLVYECNPMAMIIEQAGGEASDGQTRILDLEVRGLHQRSALFIGSKAMVKKAMEMIELYSEVYQS
ncbi:class 1 fructose-bisphosphatase [Mucilaginibacter kameinonensis]|uniref:class 1 fructose-bisphosphatase n=1 Tax=Mucilaginibacter kameinonensis TaxID=452286 RepID=UPI000EF797E5|nr:class 1 fructose-bisphosphatase [Mucilaginibacter kameinonensis]